eukprot:7024215-Pyramimonas_sp.AAC.1
MHHCRGCCSGRDDSVERGHRLLKTIVMRRIPVPKVSAWLALFTSISRILLACGLHSILIRAYLEKVVVMEVAAPDDNVEDAQLAINQEIVNFRRLERKRAAKAANWISHPQIFERLATWIAAATPLSRVHVDLFAKNKGLGKDNVAPAL